jgi:hypothetical protein
MATASREGVLGISLIGKGKVTFMKLRASFSILLASAALTTLPMVSRAQTVIAPAGRHVAREPIEWIRM